MRAAPARRRNHGIISYRYQQKIIAGGAAHADKMVSGAFAAADPGRAAFDFTDRVFDLASVRRRDPIPDRERSFDGRQLRRGAACGLQARQGRV